MSTHDLMLAHAVALAVAALAACSMPTTRAAVGPGGGDPEVGRRAIGVRHCGVCHTIPGVLGAYGVIGPSLEGVGRRSYVGGKLPNSPETLALWIRQPQHVNPGTVMPELGVSEQESRDIAAYLGTLR
jgi:cytochrome c